MKNRKKLIKRIGACFCALMMLVGCFGSMPYYAFDFSCGNYGMPSGSENYSNIVVSAYYLEDGSVGTWYVLASNSNIYMGSKYGSNAYAFGDSSWYLHAHMSSSGGDVWNKGIGEVELGDYSQIVFSNCSIYSDSSCTDVLYTPVSGSTSGRTYNSSLGYLQNVTSKRMNIYNDEDNYQSKYKFTFDTTSSSGVDLTSGDYVVRLYEQTSIYIDNIWQPFDTPKVHIGDFDASSGSLSFNISEALAKTDAETGEIDGYNFLTIALNNYVRADTYWLQIFNKETGEYGGFVQMKNNPKLPGQFTTSTVYGAEDDMSGTNGTDTGGYVDKIVDTNIGTGTNYEDAELNADNNDGLGELDDFENALNDYVSTLGSIPIMISNMFSFMPPWCLGVVGVSFSFLAILIVYKLIRG